MPAFGPMDPSAGAPSFQMDPQTVVSQPMPDPTGAILGGGAISGIGSLIGAGINLYSAAQNRKWQEHMANTAWQRGVADMRAAGINPLFAASKGGAPMPSSPPGQVNSLGLDSVGAGVASAAQAKLARYKLIQTMDMTDQQIASMKLQNQLDAAELERKDLVTQGIKNELNLSQSQIDQINANKAKAEQLKPVYEALGPWGTVGFELLKDILGKGGTGIIPGPWSGSSSARGGRTLRPIINSGGAVHDDTSGRWEPRP